VLLMLLGCYILALSEEVVLGIGLRDRRKPNKALVGVGSLSSQGLYKKGFPCQVVDLRDGREPNEALVGVGFLSSQGLGRKGSP
jgi:hypothetical protein